MKHTVLVLSALLFVWGCSKSSSTSKSPSNGSSGNPLYGCSQSDYMTQGSACFCSLYQNQSSPSCVGSTTSGTTTGGSTGGGTYTGIPKDNNWAALYPQGEPTGSCASPTGSGYPLRKGTITLAGGQMYSPALPFSGQGEFSNNISYFLMTVNDAKMFVDTDAVLKVRVKPRPEPKAPAGQIWCFGRVTGQAADTWGYMKLKYSVSVRAVNADGSLGPFMGTVSQTTGVNSCSAPIDFSGYAQSAPNGIVVVVHDVQSDQGCTYQQGCTAFKTVRAASCWQMDLEVAVDGTQSI